MAVCYNGADPKEVKWAMQELRNQTREHIFLGECPDLKIREDGVVIKVDTGLPYYKDDMPQSWLTKILIKLRIRK